MSTHTGPGKHRGSKWSRLIEKLQQERVRLGNRVRQQLWHYHPQLIGLADVTADYHGRLLR